MNDIPEAVRKKQKPKPTPKLRLPIIGGSLLGLGVLGLLGFIMILRPAFEGSVTPSVPQSSPSVVPTPEKLENVLGHLPYQEAPQSELKAITPDGRIKMRKAAAEKFQQMQRDARAKGIILVPISGFRSVKEQEGLFFGVKAQRNQETRKRAEVSAPPGYSEHHTGYAVDIGDGRNPSANVNPSFEKTAAFRWLKANAAKYNFEISFPPNNPQGVSYESWHWRYVGDRKSLETFYKAEQLKNKKNE